MKSYKLRKKNFEQLILLLIFFQLLFDTLNGFLVLNINVNIGFSIIIKFILLFICVLHLFDRNKFIISWLILFISIVLIVHLFYKDKNILFDLSEMVKLFTTIIVFYAISGFEYINPMKFIKKWIVFSSVVIVINILISIAGYGTYSYGDYGYKGFFYAANALSGVIVILTSTSLVLYENNKRIYILLSVFFLLMAIAIGTKSGILAVIISILFILIRFSNIRVKLLYLLFIISLFGSIIIINADSIINSNIVQRLIFFYDSGGITRAIFSDRNIFFKEIIDNYINGNVFNILFGLGSGFLYQLDKPLVEIDFIDIISLLGIITLLFYMVFLFLIFRKISLVQKNTICTTEIKLIYNAFFISFILISISSIAGHILFNGMTTIPWGVILAAPCWLSNYRNRIRNLYV
ncbi:TPA: O-antigen ligase family protein [Photobacterium damselae]